MQMPKVLYIAYDFPPINNGGSRRAYKFCKHLPQFGISPIVFSPPKADQNYPGFYDHDLDVQLKSSNIETIRVPLKNESLYWKHMYPKQLFHLTDSIESRWRKGLIAAIDQRISQHDIRVVVISLPPFSLSSLVPQLAKKYRLPIVVDFRDAWSQWLYRPYVSRIHYWLLLRKEAHTLMTANHVITTSDQTREDFIALHRIQREKIVTITNSFDCTLDDYPDFLKITNPDNFKIGYVGSFYFLERAHKLMMNPWWKNPLSFIFPYSPRKENWLYRTPYFFFRALKFMFERFPTYREKINVTFAGEIVPWLPRMIETFGLKENVKLLGVVSAEKALEFQRSCDMLLLTSSKVINGRDYSIAGKTFEYFLMKKPILGFLTEGSQKDLMIQAGNTLICDPDESSESAMKLKSFMDGEIEFKPNSDFIKSFNSYNTTEQLSRMLKPYMQ